VLTPSTGSRTHTRSSRGTVLLMFPAAIMIMLVLGAIVLDVGVSQVRARELQAVADSAANDALASLDVVALRNGLPPSLNPARARVIVLQSVAAGPLPRAKVESVAVGSDATGRITVEVRLSLRVDLIISPALPGGARSTTITRTGRVVIVN